MTDRPARPPSRSGSYGGIVSGVGSRSASHPVAVNASAAETLRVARRRWASGVVVVMTRDGDGFRGATVSAFTSVSVDPPLVLICLERTSRMATLVPEAGIFTVSILNRAQEFQADRFAGRAPLPNAQLTGVPHAIAPSGCPILSDSLAWLDCRVAMTHDGGDHLIVVGAVTDGSLAVDTDDPLLSYEGRYRAIEAG